MISGSSSILKFIKTLKLLINIVEYCEYNDTLIKQLEKEIENNKKQIARNKEFVTRYKKIHGKCVDCGIEDWRVLQFDHQSNKKHNISDLSGSGGGLISTGNTLTAATAGGSAGQHLCLTINGTVYKIALLNA